MLWTLCVGEGMGGIELEYFLSVLFVFVALQTFIQAFCGVRTMGLSVSQNAPVALMFRDADQRSHENVCLFQSCLSICKTFYPHILHSHSLSRSDLE